MTQNMAASLLPEDVSRITAINDGKSWIHSIKPGSVRYNRDSDSVTFDVSWNGKNRRITLAAEQVAGIEESS